MTWLYNHSWNLVTGFFVACLGYFAPIREVIYVVVAAIIIDLVIGLIASYKLGIGFKSSKMWKTVYKLCFSIVVISLAYAMDTEMSDFVQMHKIIAWLITGFEMWSILENAAKISDHKIFRLLKKLMEDKIEDTTGIKINENE